MKCYFRHFISLLVTGMLMTACASDSHHESHFFDAGDVSELPSAKLSDLIEVTKVVPLETSDSVIIGNVSRILKHGDRYYVYSERGRIAGMGTIFVFDTSNGRFICNIGQRGEGPGEIAPFTSIDFAVTDTAVFITDGSRLIRSFNPDGRFCSQYTISAPADNIIALPGKLLTYSQRDSMTWHIYSCTGEELSALAPANALSNIATSDRFLEIGGGRVMQSPTWCNETRIYDPTLNICIDTLIAEIPDVQTLTRYEQSLGPTEFGTVEGKCEGTLISRIATDGMSKLMITSAPDFSAFRLWIITPAAVTKTVDLADISDDITGNTESARPDILFSNGTPDGYIAVIAAESLGPDKDRMDSLIATVVESSGLNPESNPVIVEYRLK